MKEITNEEFVEKYKPICNDRFPTTLSKDSILHKYIWQRDEYALIAEYITPRRFFSVQYTSVGEIIVTPGLKSDSTVKGYIITECPYRPEDLCYTVIESYP